MSVERAALREPFRLRDKSVVDAASVSAEDARQQCEACTREIVRWENDFALWRLEKQGVLGDVQALLARVHEGAALCRVAENLGDVKSLNSSAAENVSAVSVTPRRGRGSVDGGQTDHVIDISLTPTRQHSPSLQSPRLRQGPQRSLMLSSAASDVAALLSDVLPSQPSASASAPSTRMSLRDRASLPTILPRGEGVADEHQKEDNLVVLLLQRQLLRREQELRQLMRESQQHR